MKLLTLKFCPMLLLSPILQQNSMQLYSRASAYLGWRMQLRDWVAVILAEIMEAYLNTKYGCELWGTSDDGVQGREENAYGN